MGENKAPTTIKTILGWVLQEKYQSLNNQNILYEGKIYFSGKIYKTLENWGNL